VKPTVFNLINKETNKPYLDSHEATLLIKAFFRKNSPKFRKFLTKLTPDDLLQEMLCKLCSAPYDPSKSLPSTFVWMCCESRLGQLYIQYFTREKDGKGMKTVLVGDKIFMMDKSMSHSPEDVYMVKEHVGELRGKMPDGYRHQRELRNSKPLKRNK